MSEEVNATFLFVILMIFLLLGISLVNNFFRDRCFEKGGEYYSVKTGCMYRKDLRND